MATRRTSSSSAKAIKKLPWPKALLGGGELSIREVYRTGKLIVEKVRAGQGYHEGTSVDQLATLLGSSRATLYRAVKAYEVINKYELQDRLVELQPTLLYNLERLPANRRKRFLEKALKEGWSKREIMRQISDLMEKAVGSDWRSQRKRTTLLFSPKSGPRTPPPVDALKRAAERLSEAPPKKNTLTAAQLAQAKKSMQAIQRQLKKWEKALT